MSGKFQAKRYSLTAIEVVSIGHKKLIIRFLAHFVTKPLLENLALGNSSPKAEGGKMVVFSNTNSAPLQVLCRCSQK